MELEMINLSKQFKQKEAVKFRTLSADWKCPECGAEKRDFIRLHRTKE